MNYKAEASPGTGRLHPSAEVPAVPLAAPSLRALPVLLSQRESAPGRCMVTVTPSAGRPSSGNT